MYFETITSVCSQRRYLVVGFDFSEMEKKYAADYSAYHHLNLETIPLGNLKGHHLIVGFSDSTGAQYQLEKIRGRFLKRDPRLQVTGLLIPARTATEIRDKGYVYSDELPHLKLTIVILGGPPQRVTEYITKQFGLTEQDLPEVQEESKAG